MNVYLRRKVGQHPCHVLVMRHLHPAEKALDGVEAVRAAEVRRL